MPPLRGRSRRRGEVSPRRGRDYSPRRRRVIRSRDRDREDTFSARDKRERFANTLKSNAANLAAKNTQRQKARLNAANKRGIGLLPNSLKDQLKKGTPRSKPPRPTVAKKRFTRTPRRPTVDPRRPRR
tara:strand:+ start:161 stop:544 length:384 start_codon:yes stop_codon:yes gene_type:complete